MKCRNIKTRFIPGLTLLEMVIALAMMSIIFASIVPQFAAIRNSWASKQGSAESLQNGRILIDHLNHNLAKAVKITAVSDSSETDGYIQFEDNDGSDVRYEIAAGYVQFGEVGDLSDLAGPVSQLQFTCYDACDLDAALDISTADINDIRFVKAETTLTNSAALGQDKTLTASVYLRANWNSDLDSGLVGWWKLDESSGLAAEDSSGSDNDGTLTDMAGDEWTTGVVGGALTFDGSNDHIAGIGNCPTGDYTVAGWAKDTGDSDWKAFYSAEQEIWLGVDSGASAAVWLDCGGNGNGANTAAGTWTQNAWHHIAATWDGSNIHIYLDGVDMSITIYGSPENATATAAVIGAWSQTPTDENWYGSLDDVRIYNRALSAEEIAALSNVLRYESFTESKATSDTTSIIISTPSSISENDLLIAAVVTDGDTSVSMAPPGGEGWTEIDVDGYSGEVTLGVWWKLADASESSTHEFTWSGDEQAYAWMMRFTGHNPDDPINDWAAGSESSSTPTSPEVTTTVDDCIILRLGGFDDEDITLNNPGLSGHTAITMDTSGGTVTAMYWADEEIDKIQRGDIDGSNIEDLVTAAVMKPRALTLDTTGGKIYWADEEVDKIQRADLDGSNIEDLITGIAQPRALALDVAGGKMYWADEDAEKIQRADLDGSNIEDVVTGLTKPKALALDVVGGKIYWADEDADKIQRANLDGSNIEDLVTAAVMKPRALTLDIAGGKMYWADEEVDKIRRADLDGSNIEDLVTGIAQPRALALDVAGGKMYWADEDADKIQRSDLDGSNIEDLITGIAKPKALALALNEAGSGESISGGAGYVKQSAGGYSGTSNFSLTESEQSRTITIAIAPAPGSDGGGTLLP